MGIVRILQILHGIGLHKSVEKAYATRFPDGKTVHLVLRTDNGPQYIPKEFRESKELFGIRLEYIQKHTPEDNGDVESFHNSLKADYIWVTDLETFEDAHRLMEYAFTDYNGTRSHSSIDYLLPDEFERKWNQSADFRKKWIEKEIGRYKHVELLERTQKTV